METGLFVHGIIIGIALAAPVGPIALMCLHRTFSQGRLHGVVSGLGIATADAFYAAVAAFGLALISDFLLARQWFFRLFGGIALVAVGLRIFFAAPPAIEDKPEPASYLAGFSTMLALTLANPLTILFFTIIIPGFGVVIEGNSWVFPAVFVAGVFIGEMIWWTILCGSVGSVRAYLTQERLHLINRLAGLVIAIFGVALIVSLFLPDNLL